MPVTMKKSRVHEQGGGVVVTHSVATETFVIVGNTSTSNVASNGEYVDSAFISKIAYGTANGAYFTVARGANTVAVVSGTGELLLDGLPIINDPTANVTVTLSGSPGFVALELKTESHFA